MTPASGGRVARLGVVGLDYWGPNLVRNVVDSPRAELAWLCDSNPHALLPLGRRYPSARRTAPTVAEALSTARKSLTSASSARANSNTSSLGSRPVAMAERIASPKRPAAKIRVRMSAVPGF